MSSLWQKSLLFRTVGSIIAITVVIGGLIMAALGFVVARENEREAYRRLGELLDTVESTVRIACFVDDAKLAEEVAQGLLKTHEVIGVVIHSDGQELSRLLRADLPADTLPTVAPLERQIFSPFDNTQSVGRIVLYPDAAAIEARAYAAVWQMATQMGLLILAVAIALMATVLRLVVRPLGTLSQRLRWLDPASGKRLQAPRGHQHDALGNLTEKINELSSRLVNTIEQEKALRREHEINELKYRSIFDNAESGIFVADIHGRLSSGNPAFRRLTGYDAETASSNLLDFAWTDRRALERLVQDCVGRKTPLGGDFELISCTGEAVWLNLSLTPISSDTFQCVATDVTERHRSQVEAIRRALTDALTGLDNRQGFEQRWQDWIATTPERPFTLLIVNLDKFKRINDALGIPFGNKLLALIANRLVACLKPSDTVARIGGDEFAVVLPDASKDTTVANVGIRIVERLCENYRLDGKEAMVGVSVGAARFPQDGADLPTLLRNAELALADARTGGGRTWRLFHPAMVQAIEARHQLASDLRRAAAGGELRLYYQPIVDLSQHRVSGAEALIRWQHPVHGMIPPDNFIPLAEETGLITDIGLWCLRTACSQIAEWQSAGHPLRVTINVSALQIPDGLPPQRILATCQEFDVAPGQLGIEITESTLMGESAQIRAWLDAVHSSGFSTYLDDFGTGYSSLSYLKRFPVDIIKIDKAFIREMSETSNDRVMVEAVIMMAESLSLKVVAEGIETAGQLEILERMGCTYGQGFHFSRPLPAEQFLAVARQIEADHQATHS